MAAVIGTAVFDTALGPCVLAWSQKGVARLLIPEPKVGKRVMKERASELGPLMQPPAAMVAAMDAIARALAGEDVALNDIAVDIPGSAFRRRIYSALRRVPRGTTISYGELAAKAGSPGAARAVGRAMATNPCPIIVPCHRVLPASGEPGSFSAGAGTSTKLALLSGEGVRLRPGRRRRALPYDVVAAEAHLRRADRRLRKVIDRVGPAQLWCDQHRSTFMALAEAIVYQQLSGKAAGTIFGRVVALFGGDTLKPAEVLAATDRQLRGAGLSRAKLAALRDLATRTVAGEIPTLRQLTKLDDETIIERLTQVRGIGRWTVEMLLLFQLGRPDVLALGDLGLRKGYAVICGRDELPTPAELDAAGEAWRPFRSLASWYLWRAVDTPLMG